MCAPTPSPVHTTLHRYPTRPAVAIWASPFTRPFQTWYQCYTCNLSGNEGCCEACARVCHKVRRRFLVPSCSCALSASANSLRRFLTGSSTLPTSDLVKLLLRLRRGRAQLQVSRPSRAHRPQEQRRFVRCVGVPRGKIRTSEPPMT